MAEHAAMLRALDSVLDAGSGPTSSLTAEQWETRVERVIAMMARGAHDEAARTSEALLREGVRDVRLVGPYVFGAFLSHGVSVLPALLSTLHAVFTRGWERLAPEDNKALLADSGLLWLFKTLHRHLDFHGRAQDDVWERWCSTCTEPHIREALEHADTLVAPLEQRLNAKGGSSRLVQVMGWLTENRERFPRPAEPPPEARAEEPVAAPADNVAVAATPDESKAPMPPDEERLHEPPAVPREREQRASTPAHSPAFEQLLRKLAAFEQLVKRHDYARASVVATDVLHVIEHFDPLTYLPSLFSPFLAGMSEHAEHIEPRLQGARSLGGRVLEQLYRTDLEAFVRGASSTGDGR
ncbi:type VI secretion system protein IglI family protein [Myxococcus fulvus]|uniref:type VI secretion system protein IglI family protein n=1 Tax=Myxococcus fulvus TaxID=33 RepID=UPI003B99BC73